MGYQNDEEYGTVVFVYRDDTIRSISYSLFINEIDTGDFIKGAASMGIGLVDFSPAELPEPSTGLLAALGLLGMALCSHRSKRKCA